MCGYGPAGKLLQSLRLRASTFVTLARGLIGSNDWLRTCRPGVQVPPGAPPLSRNRCFQQTPIIAVKSVLGADGLAPVPASSPAGRSTRRCPVNSLSNRVVGAEVVAVNRR